MFGLLIGHLVGDYLLQSDWMAKGKSQPGIRGDNICLLHCFIYSLAVTLAVILDGWRIPSVELWRSIGAVFVIASASHYPIDRWSLAKKWMGFYGQTTEGPFAPLVYVAVDNGVHLTLTYVAFRVLERI